MRKVTLKNPASMEEYGERRGALLEGQWAHSGERGPWPTRAVDRQKRGGQSWGPGKSCCPQTLRIHGVEGGAESQGWLQAFCCHRLQEGGTLWEETGSVRML